MARKNNKSRAQREFKRQLRKGFVFGKKQVKPVFQNKTNDFIKNSKKVSTQPIVSMAKQVIPIYGKVVVPKLENSTRKQSAYRDYIWGQVEQGNVMPMETVAQTIVNEFRRSLTPYAGLISGHASPQYDLFNEWIDKLIDEYGIYDVARMLEDGINAGILVTRDVMYNDDSFNNYITQMMDYLPDAGVLTKEAIGEYLEGLDYNY